VRSILIVAGEPSGDLHGANLVKKLEKLAPDIEFFGIGGDRMKEQGVDLIYHINDISVVGILEVLSRLNFIKKAMRSLYYAMAARNPNAAILIDYPGFNLRFARLAKVMGLVVIYYIMPQIWAWGMWRVHSIRRFVDKAIVILPFEKPIYERMDLDVHFVGHPLLDFIGERHSSKKDLIGLFPGSREDEVKRILPIMLRCAKELSDEKFCVALAPGIKRKLVSEIIEQICPCAASHIHTDPLWTSRRACGEVEIFEGSPYELMERSKLLLVASGTVTLEAAIIGVPMLILYKLAPLSYFLGRLLVNIPYIGLVNILAGSEVVPEFIQWNAKPSRVVPQMRKLLNDQAVRQEMEESLINVKNMLGEKGGVARAAQIIYESIK
jgi:lipid-A-disaccharide synthase